MNAVSIALAWTLACTPVLEISAGHEAVFRAPLGADASFSVTYWHSMYDVPFTEDYVVTADRQIRLEALRSDDGTVLDYYGLAGIPGEVRALDRRFSSLAFGVAAKHPQTLTVAGRTWSFLEFQPAGSSIVIEPAMDCD